MKVLALIHRLTELTGRELESDVVVQTSDDEDECHAVTGVEIDDNCGGESPLVVIKLEVK